MRIEKSVHLRGVRFISIQIPQDLKGTRLVTYSWPTLLTSGSKERFPFIFRKVFHGDQVLYGIYLYPNSTNLVRCTKGRCRLFYTELRMDEKIYLKSDVIDLSAENRKQIYLPVGVGWSVLTQDGEAELQVQASEDLNAQTPTIIDPLDPRMNIADKLYDMEFKLGEYPDRLINVEAFEGTNEDAVAQPFWEGVDEVNDLEVTAE